jgi:AraC family transcriptional regulator of adaptative response / DNA-3-methyladenine glycosylase II
MVPAMTGLGRGSAPGSARLLPVNEPFARQELFDFVAARAIPGVEEADALSYRRSIASEGGATVVTVDAGPAGIRLSTSRRSSLTEALVAGISVMFGMDVDPHVVDRHLSGSRLLRPLVARRPGLRVPGTLDPFELGVRAILGQQVTVKGASTLAGRLVAALGEPLETPAGTVTHLFPTPRLVAAADLSRIGMPQSRRDTVTRFAAAVAAGDVVLDRAADSRLGRRRLLAIPGIGPWTADYIAMRALRDPDAMPTGDLGLRRAIERLAPGSELAAQSEAWRPWRAYAAMHLWASLADARPD